MQTLLDFVLFFTVSNGHDVFGNVVALCLVLFLRANVRLMLE